MAMHTFEQKFISIETAFAPSKKLLIILQEPIQVLPPT